MQASLSEIAERADISVAGLNHHFSTKTQLLEAVFDHKQRETEARFTSTDPMALLRAALDLAEQGQSDPQGTRFFAVMSTEATSPDHPAHEYFRRRYETTLDLVRASFVTLREQGRLRPGVDPADAARAYIGLSDGLQIQALYQPEAFSQADVMRRIISEMLTEPL
ncbi:TetR family transcriptional regulator [Microbacterium aerolatum]|uniref:TetR family transcriptional regulator n=2 Tax=Microbacterium aerolatum TaxID=153731 RepID=A0A511AH15_9MICO|nr:TetR family transcriptional regulator [Microbacterium aerolatum]GGB33479.1 TetR family transcriptional regulator [Microbacterium aerolatum]